MDRCLEHESLLCHEEAEVEEEEAAVAVARLGGSGGDGRARLLYT
ncbi:unnamed protein product, partial [Heterotrigona itama]